MSVVFDPYDPRALPPPGTLLGHGYLAQPPVPPSLLVDEAAGFQPGLIGASLSFGQTLGAEGARRDDVLTSIRHAVWAALTEMKASGYRLTLSPAHHLDIQIVWYGKQQRDDYQPAEGELRLRVAALAKRVEILCGRPEIVGFAQSPPSVQSMGTPAPAWGTPPPGF